jgi:hypothetical protein
MPVKPGRDATEFLEPITRTEVDAVVPGRKAQRPLPLLHDAHLRPVVAEVLSAIQAYNIHSWVRRRDAVPVILTGAAPARRRKWQ